MAALDDLLASIFGTDRPALYPEFAGWLRESRRFREFAARHHSKIRAKLRGTRDAGGLLDLRAELEAAALLLRDERCTLEYEKYAASGRRGPDFTVTFKTHTPFNVEVRRIRPVEMDDGDPGAPPGKLISVLCDKVGQLPPSMINLLWLAAERELAAADVDRAAAALRQLAARKDEDFFARRGFAGASAFLRHYQRLSAIVVRQPGGTALWLNPLARHTLPPPIAAALQRLGRTEP